MNTEFSWVSIVLDVYSMHQITETGRYTELYEVKNECVWIKLRSCSSHDKTNKVSVHPAKTQISLCAQWVAKDPSFLHADSEDWSDWADAQADLSLRWAHSHFVGFVMR